MIKPEWTAAPLTYLDVDNRLIIYFRFDAETVEAVLGLIDPPPVFSCYHDESQRLPFWLSAAFDTDANFVAASIALRLTFNKKPV